jgi:hypothetical protein
MRSIAQDTRLVHGVTPVLVFCATDFVIRPLDPNF